MVIKKEFEDHVSKIVEYHSVEESVSEIYLVDTKITDHEMICLLEVNSRTVPVGVEPLYLPQDKSTPFCLCIIELTPEEFDSIPEGLKLPEGWEIEECLFKRESIGLNK